MLINVLAKHIKAGKQGECDQCPVALAVGEALKISDDQFVEADVDEIVLSENRSFNTVAYQVPRSVKRFITRFDENKKSVKPFRFILRATQD